MSHNISVYLCYLLRHHPEKAHLDMDTHGWVSTEQLIHHVCQYSTYALTAHLLEEIVSNDEKGRYRFSPDKSRIKCCQGHSIPWVKPELRYDKPPQCLYHGTTTAAFEKIKESGEISRMERHHVHLQPVEKKAWQPAKRWHLTPVILEVDSAAMYADGYVFGVAENGVWCTKTVPTKYICNVKKQSIG